MVYSSVTLPMPEKRTLNWHEKRAIELFGDALSLSSGLNNSTLPLSTYCARGKVYLEAGHLEEARQDFEEALKISSSPEDKKEPLLSLLNIHMGQENLDAALTTLDVLAEIGALPPKWRHRIRAEIFSAQGKLQEALEEYDAVIAATK